MKKLSLGLFLMSAILGLVFCFGMVGCSESQKQTEDMLNQHPEIISKVMEQHPDLFAETIQKVMMSGRAKMQERQMQQEKEHLESQFKSPLQPDLSENRSYFGDKKAPIVIVEYSDFQCPYCKMGYTTVEQIREKYKDKVAILFKNHPLPMHPMALPAAKRFEAIRSQNPDLAFSFYKEVFEHQDKLGGGEKFLDEVAHKLKVNMAKMKADMNSSEIQSRIDKDSAEAQKFGLSGTPGFVVNGIAINGARDAAYFSGIIERLLAASK